MRMKHTSIRSGNFVLNDCELQEKGTFVPKERQFLAALAAVQGSLVLFSTQGAGTLPNKPKQSQSLVH